MLSQVLWADSSAQPGRAVRLSSVDGKVQVFQGGQVLAESAVVNTPLFEGSQVTTADDGRAEIQFEDGSVARLSPNSSLALTNLARPGQSSRNGNRAAKRFGLLRTCRAGQAGKIQVDFGDSAVTAGGFTVLRINLDTPPGELAVFSGNAHLVRGTALTVDLHGGESVALNATDATDYKLSESIEPDSWDAGTRIATRC